MHHTSKLYILQKKKKKIKFCIQVGFARRYTAMDHRPQDLYGVLITNWIFLA